MAILPQYLSIFPKDNANRGQNKMNEFILFCQGAAYLRFFGKAVSTFSNFSCSLHIHLKLNL